MNSFTEKELMASPSEKRDLARSSSMKSSTTNKEWVESPIAEKDFKLNLNILSSLQQLMLIKSGRASKILVDSSQTMQKESY